MSISKGNTKLGRIPNISLPPIKSCKHCKHCKNDCYALKAYKMYKVTRESWDNNLSLAKKDIVKYMINIVEYLDKHYPTFFRWHVSGDIINQEYYDYIEHIAAVFPSIKFLVFTKEYQIDFKIDSKPANLSVVFSAWPTMPDNEIRYDLPISWMQDGTEARIPDNALVCPGNCETCGMCFSLSSIGRDVYFLKH